MKRLMLDTSVYSAIMKGVSPAKLAVQQADEIYLNPVVLGELAAGFSKGTQSKKNE